MTKLKLKLASYFYPRRCINLIRNILMAHSSSRSNIFTGTKKKIKVRKLSSPSFHCPLQRCSSIPGEILNANEFIPLAARDSQWVGITFVNPNFHIQEGYEETDDEQEIQVLNVDGKELPIYSLFPKLREKLPAKTSFTSSEGSPTDITKLLVGEKPNFEYLKRSKKCTPIKLSLPSLKENPNEEKADEEHTNSTKKSDVKSRCSDEKRLKRPLQENESSNKEQYDEEDDSDSKTRGAKKKKKTKKRTDAPSRNLDMDSSYSGLSQTTKRPTAKHKILNMLKSSKRSSKKKNVQQQSSQGSLADDEDV